MRCSIRDGWEIATSGIRRAGRGMKSAGGRKRSGGLLRELKAEANLRRAFAQDKLELRYEPIVALNGQAVVGFEALTRWKQSDGGLGSFGPHVGIAEESGLIVPIGSWVIREACEQLQRWNASRPDANAFVSVNVSGRQLIDPGFLPDLTHTLAETGIDPDKLKLEITESIVMRDADEPLLWKIKDLGISLHMDDFGTGYSSLSCLHRFPIDMLKIDRSFIRNTSTRRDYAPVLHAVVELAHHLGMEVVAEGLEEASQVALLRAMGCDYGQGYYWSRGASEDEALAMLPAPERNLKSA